MAYQQATWRDLTDKEISLLPKSQKEAKARGVRYYTGKACKHGHKPVRTKGSRGCVFCSSARNHTAAHRREKKLQVVTKKPITVFGITI